MNRMSLFKTILLPLLAATAVIALLGTSCKRESVSESEFAWALVKISYDPNSMRMEGGVCGTVFFVNKRTFVTAHHCSQVFDPNQGYPKVKVFLIDQKGNIIHDIQITQHVPEYDLAIGKILTDTPSVGVCMASRRAVLGDSVYNIGFPTDQGLSLQRGFSECQFRIQNDNLIIDKIKVNQFKQSGTIEHIQPVTVHANDVTLDYKTTIGLDYSSRTGFSGGPLLEESSGKVIGMMSFLVPEQYDIRKPAMAIRIEDIARYVHFENLE